MLKISQTSVADQINDFVRQMPVEEQKDLYLKLKRRKHLRTGGKKVKAPGKSISPTLLFEKWKDWDADPKTFRKKLWLRRK